jgi:signal transduction histidine kinase
MAAQRDAAEREAAAAAERQRLARAVHDGVLQVLALVQRQGRAAGGDFAALALLAGEQEESLRSLIRQQDTVSSAAGEQVDLGGELERLVLGHHVEAHLVTPGEPVPMDTTRARELLGIVKACLDNVAAHVGDDAPAWLLLDSSGDNILVSVRDEGPGIAQGRVSQAREQGRLGIASSICGRAEELGGTARLETGTWGTEWEIEVPR